MFNQNYDIFLLLEVLGIGLFIAAVVAPWVIIAKKGLESTRIIGNICITIGAVTGMCLVLSLVTGFSQIGEFFGGITMLSLYLLVPCVIGLIASLFINEARKNRMAQLNLARTQTAMMTQNAYQQPQMNNQPVTLNKEEDVYDKISKLAKLKNEGAITEEDYEVKKKELLSNI